MTVSSLLLVDDDQDSFHFTQALVLGFDAGVTTLDWEPTYDGGLSALLENKHDAALIDYRLGADNGVALLRAARAAGCETPLIILTGQAVRGIDAEAFSAGADDYLIKGEVTPAQLERSLRYATERRRDVSELKKAQQELTHVFDLSPDMICTATFDGFFTRTNPAFTRTLGFSAEELQQKQLLSFVHEDDRAATLRELGRLAEGHTTFGFTNRYRTASGDYRWVEWHSKADTEAQLIYAVARDQTEKRLLEEQFRQAQKMEAIGRLAGGVAHDFNNLLTAILGFAELAIDDLPHGDARRTDIAHIVHAGNSAKALTRQLLAFSRKQILAPRVLDLNALVTGMQPMLRRLIGEHIELQTATGPDVLPINADPGQIEQVLMNLAVNARDAMPRGGVLRMATDIVDLDVAFASANACASTGRHVRLTLTDTGVGMAPDVLAHLFEPFFTTKEQGKGTGLGLATVYGIVQQSGGCISVVSTEGVGTTFAVHFPSVDATATPAADAGVRSRSLSGTETILLVEDQAEVRQVVSQILTRRGYAVIEARDGASALDLLRSRTGPVDMILTDVVMPGMNGRELLDSLAAGHRELPVLYMSGYTDDEILKHVALHPDMNFIHKPFQPEQLLGRVRDVLDG